MAPYSSDTGTVDITILPPAPPTPELVANCDSTTRSCTFLIGSTRRDRVSRSCPGTSSDGTTSTEANPSHTYGSSGTYQVQLTVIDPCGQTGSTSQQVTVDAPPKRFLHS